MLKNTSLSILNSKYSFFLQLFLLIKGHKILAFFLQIFPILNMPVIYFLKIKNFNKKKHISFYLLFFNNINYLIMYSNALKLVNINIKNILASQLLM